MKGQRLTLHHFGFDPASLSALRDALEELGREWRAVLDLKSGSGDVVLVDEHVPHTVPQSILHAFREGRPCVTVAREPPAAGMARGAIAAQALRQALLAEIETLQHAATPPEGADRLAAVRGRGDAAGEGFDSGFDSRWPGPSPLDDQDLDADRQLLLDRVRRLYRSHRSCRSRLNTEEAKIGASFGPGRSLLLDFAQGLTWTEVEALHCLRVQRELPYPAPSGTLALGHQFVRELDLTLWDLGVAAGAYPLLDAPARWWHTEIRPDRLHEVPRYSSLPAHLELARATDAGGLTPAQLRRACRTSIAETRCFLQACLLLGLVQWAQAAQPAQG